VTGGFLGGVVISREGNRPNTNPREILPYHTLFIFVRRGEEGGASYQLLSS
jgi:hypothetical protein